MANNDIKQRIILEGEQQYKTALQDASRNLKTLRSELKAETAELGKNATEQQKNEAKTKSLTKQIKEQEKVVDTYKKALDEVKDKYGDNEAAVAKWEQKYNEARATLANMKNDLDGVGTSLKNVSTDASMGTVAANSFANAFSGLSTLGSSISDGLENIFSSMAERVRAVAAELWDLIAETASRADAWGDLAGFYGSTAEEVQAMDRAITGAGADFQQFLNFMNQLEFKGKDKGLVEWLGISDENYEDKFEFAVLAMTELAKKQKELGAGKFNEQLGEIFSGKSVGIVELIGEWDRVLEKRQEYEEKGYLLDDHELGTMNEVDNTLKDIEERWDMLKSKFASGFGQTSLDVMVNVSAGLDALAKYFDAETPEERETALEEFKESMLAVFESIAQAIRDGLAILEGLADELKQSEDPIVQGIGNILGGIVDALKWFTEDNAQNAVRAFEILAGFWIAGKGLKFVAKIGELAGHIATIKSYQGLQNLLNGGFSGASGASGAAGSAVGSAAGGATGGGFFASLKSLVTSNGLSVLAPLGVFFAGITPALMANQKTFEDSEKKLEERQAAAEKLTGENAQFLSRAASALGYQRNANGEIDRNFLGAALLGDNEEIESILMGMGNRSDLQKAQLYNLLQGAYSEWNGNSAWNELQSLWSGKGEFDTGRLTGLLETITKVYEKLPEGGVNSEWWRTGGQDENGITRQDLNNFNSLPDKTASAVSRAVGGIRFEVDGQSMGRAVAPYVSEYIARDITP